MPDLMPSPSELLAERISDIETSRHHNPEKMLAFFFAASKALPTILRAAEAGNVQCQECEREIEPYLKVILKK